MCYRFLFLGLALASVGRAQHLSKETLLDFVNTRYHAYFHYNSHHSVYVLNLSPGPAGRIPGDVVTRLKEVARAWRKPADLKRPGDNSKRSGRDRVGIPPGIHSAACRHAPGRWRVGTHRPCAARRGDGPVSGGSRGDGPAASLTRPRIP